MPRALLLYTLTVATLLAQKYSGPRPPKPDVLYLLHADNLVAAEPGDAKEETRKDETIYVVSGASSSARTPLAEPIFLIEADKINPQRLELHRFDVRNGRREVALPLKRRRNAPRPLRISVTQLSGKLYRVEVSEPLENGEYSISPNDSNTVFCFQVY